MKCSRRAAKTQRGPENPVNFLLFSALLREINPVFQAGLRTFEKPCHLDEDKLVEASAVMGQVDGMLKELDPPPEWLLREVEVQATRLAAVTQQQTR